MKEQPSAFLSPLRLYAEIEIWITNVEIVKSDLGMMKFMFVLLENGMILLYLI